MKLRTTVLISGCLCVLMAAFFCPKFFKFFKQQLFLTVGSPLVAMVMFYASLSRQSLLIDWTGIVT